MTLLVTIVVWLLVVVGLVGTVVPLLPGLVLILGGIALHAIVFDFDPIGPWRLAAFGVLTLVGHALDYAAGALGARHFGGSRWAVLGAILGAVVGLFFGPLGVLLGPVAGAVLLEWLYSQRFRESLQTGVGTVVGMLVASLAKLVLGVVMVSLFAYWLWRG